MQTIDRFVFERGLTSAGSSQGTSVPAGAGPLDPISHIKPPLPQDQRAGQCCGTIPETTSRQLSWDFIKTVLWVPHVRFL